jgi:hypothetical protein
MKFQSCQWVVVAVFKQNNFVLGQETGSLSWYCTLIVINNWHQLSAAVLEILHQSERQATSLKG